MEQVRTTGSLVPIAGVRIRGVPVMTAATFTSEAQEHLKQYLGRPGYIIPTGLGTKEAACSVAAINLAISSELADHIPDCMSRVIGEWIIYVQDRMPSEMRNSERWKTALVYAPGTGRDHEYERFDMIVNWMWTTVLPSLQPVIDKHDFGDQWRHMCEQRTEVDAREVHRAIFKKYTATNCPTGAYEAAYAAAYAGDVAKAAHDAADVARTKVMGDINVNLFDVTAMASILTNVNDASNDPNIWERLNPVGLFEHLVWYKAIGRVVYVE